MPGQPPALNKISGDCDDAVIDNQRLNDQQLVQQMATFLELNQPLTAPRSAAWRAISTLSGLAGWQADQVQPISDSSRSLSLDAPNEPAVEKGPGELLRPGNTIALRWALPSAGTELEVVAMEPDQSITLRGDTSTALLTLWEGSIHLRLESESSDEAGLRASWQLSLSQLAHYVERHPGRKRQVRWTHARVNGSPELLHAYFTEEALLRQWFTSSGNIPTRGAFELMLFAMQQKLVGRVLHNSSGRDVLISLTNQSEATLALRTLPAIAEKDALVCALCLSTWGVPGDSVELLDTHMRSSLQALKRLLSQRAAC